jgi:glycosyltransferase involved in cell wall biosynthesis
MKICFLSYRGNMYSGGQGIYLYYLTRELAKRGHEITILVGPPYPWDMPWARVIKITNHNYYARRLANYSPEQILKIFSPINFYEFAATRFWFFPEMLTYSARAFVKLAELFKGGAKFDLIHDNQCLGYGQALVKGFGVPVMASIHHPLAMDRGADFVQSHTVIERARRVVFYPLVMQKIVAQQMDLVISGSKDSADAVQKAFVIDPGKMRVVYDGIDETVFYPRPEVKRVRGRLIFVGNTEDRKKGILYLMQALHRLPEWVNLTIVDGGAKWKFYLNQLMDRYKLRKRLIIKERLSPEDLALEYCQAEVGVVPSLYEGFGLPAAEAMACATPVISSTAGALPEVVGNDSAGVLIPPKDPYSIGREVMNLLEKPDLRREMGIRAAARVKELFTWAECARGTEEVYEELLGLKKYADRRLQSA